MRTPLPRQVVPWRTRVWGWFTEWRVVASENAGRCQHDGCAPYCQPCCLMLTVADPMGMLWGHPGALYDEQPADEHLADEAAQPASEPSRADRPQTD